MAKFKLDLGQTLGEAGGRKTGSAMRSPIPKTLFDAKAALGTAKGGRKTGAEMTGTVPKVDMGKTMGTSASGGTTGSAKAGISPKSPKA